MDVQCFKRFSRLLDFNLTIMNIQLYTVYLKNKLKLKFVISHLVILVVKLPRIKSLEVTLLYRIKWPLGSAWTEDFKLMLN